MCKHPVITATFTITHELLVGSGDPGYAVVLNEKPVMLAVDVNCGECGFSNRYIAHRAHTKQAHGIEVWPKWLQFHLRQLVTNRQGFGLTCADLFRECGLPEE